MKLLVLTDAKFTCSACAKCCRNWHVELLPDEIERVSHLAWPAGDPLLGVKPVMKHSGHTYLAHREDGICVFLNLETNLCRIHAQFGAEVKPLGCRLYPFQIVPTFKGEATITPRFGCPTVRANQGLPHEDSLPELRELARRMQMPADFDEATCCYLDRGQIDAVCEFAATLIHGFDRNDQRALFLICLCDWLTTITTDDLDRAALGNSFAAIKQAVEAISAAPVKRPGFLTRLVFRTFLGLHLRRDEDVLDGRAGRFSRMMAMIGCVMGFTDLHKLGIPHPTGSLQKASLFQTNVQPGDSAVFDLHWRMIATKLMSLQFMGSANGNRDLLVGLRSLALLYPLVCATAKYRAGNRGVSIVEIEDVDYAVAMIEHSFGRSPILSQSFARSFEKMLLEPSHFVGLVRTI
jgi:lysine-N-methylase